MLQKAAGACNALRLFHMLETELCRRRNWSNVRNRSDRELAMRLSGFEKIALFASKRRQENARFQYAHIIKAPFIE